MTDRRGLTLIELILVIVLLEVLVVHLPDVLRRASVAEQRSALALDAAAARASLTERLRADLDAARDAQVSAGTLLLAGPESRWVLWAPAGGALVRVDAEGLRAWAGFGARPSALARTPRGRLVEIALDGPGGPPLPVSRLWAGEAAR